jgi:membrane protein DedA with SNARE-associated domain
MTELVAFLLRHGYTVLFIAVFLEQFGVPVPSAPILLAAGALAAHGDLSFFTAFGLSVVATLMGDLVWFQLGRSRGHKVLKLLCKLSLEPDSCVRRTEDLFARHGGRALLLAKFIPGFGVAIPPMAGHLGMHFIRFLLLDLAGAVLWICAFSGAGFLFSEQIEGIALMLARLGNWAVILAAAGLAGYLVWKYVQRRRYLGKLRVARISPDELMRQLAAGEAPVIIDLRHELELGTEDFRLPGAINMIPNEVARRHQEIPRDRDIVLYCT